jgi:hypothetical protein
LLYFVSVEILEKLCDKKFKYNYCITIKIADVMLLIVAVYIHMTKEKNATTCVLFTHLGIFLRDRDSLTGVRTLLREARQFAGLSQTARIK